MIKQRRNILLASLGLTLVVSGLLLTFGSPKALALNENTQNIPPAIQSVFNNDTNCNGNHESQYVWASVAGDNSSDTAYIPYGTDTIDLWVNTTATNCEGGVTNGVVTDTNLQRTRSTISATSAAANIPGQPSKGLTIPWFGPGYVDAEYTNSYPAPAGSAGNGGNRWVTDGSNNPWTQTIKVSGLASIQQTDYDVVVQSTERPVNQFANGGYYCVQNGNVQPVDLDGKDANGNYVCLTWSNPITIHVKVRSVPIGNVDKVSCSVAGDVETGKIIGWAMDPAYPTRQPMIQMFVDGKYVYGQQTSVPRADVNAAYPQTGNTPLGFRIDTSPFEDAYNHTFKVYALDTSGGSTSTLLGTFQLGPCRPPTCVITTAGQPAINTPFDIILTVKYSPGGQGLSIKPTGTVQFFGNVQNFNYPETWGDVSHTFSGFVQTGPGGVVANGTIFQPGVVAATGCNTSFNVAALPYLKVYGNDIAAGGKFADVDAKTCSPGPKTAANQPPASIWTFNKKVTSEGTYYGGASSQFGAFALGQIYKFSTAGTRNGAASPVPPIDLSFGNMVKTGGPTPATVSEDMSGFSGMYRCIPDYFSTSSKLPQAGATLLPGNTPIVTTTTIADGTQIVDYVDGGTNPNGGAYIQKNITYANTGGWASPARIPSYYLIVKGDIYIDNDVTQLDGVYIAQPRSDGTGGHIYTCTNGGNAFPPLWAKEDLYNNCQKTLTVTGSFIANQIKFQRARGTVENSTAGPGAQNEGPSSNNIAEVFNFSQEMYLAPTPSILDTVIGNSTSSNVFQSITSLPPIL